MICVCIEWFYIKFKLSIIITSTTCVHSFTFYPIYSLVQNTNHCALHYTNYCSVSRNIPNCWHRMVSYSLRIRVDAFFFSSTQQRIYIAIRASVFIWDFMTIYFRILVKLKIEKNFSFRWSTWNWTSWKMWKKKPFNIVTQFCLFFSCVKMISIVLLFRWKFRSSFPHNSARLLYCGCVKV